MKTKSSTTEDVAQSEELVEFLSNPDSYPEPSRQVEMRETHILSIKPGFRPATTDRFLQSLSRVRAKVAALRSSQLDSKNSRSTLESERSYLQLASEYVNELETPLVIVVGGLTGTGKSTLAAFLQPVAH